MNNKQVFFKKVKTVIKESGLEENVLYARMTLRVLSDEYPNSLMPIKKETTNLYNFLRGKQDFDELETLSVRLVVALNI